MGSKLLIETGILNGVKRFIYASSGSVYGVKEEGEDIKVVVKSLGDALKMVDRGIIANSASIIGIQWLTLNKKKIRKKWL